MESFQFLLTSDCGLTAKEMVVCIIVCYPEAAKTTVPDERWNQISPAILLTANASLIGFRHSLRRSPGLRIRSIRIFPLRLNSNFARVFILIKWALMQAALLAAFSSLLSFRSITFYASLDDDSEALLQQSLKMKIRNAECNKEKQLKQLIFTREWKEFNRSSWMVESCVFQCLSGWFVGV